MTIFRFINGIIDTSHIAPILCGMFGISFGLVFANKIVDKINGDMIRKITYAMIGISGIINLL